MYMYIKGSYEVIILDYYSLSLYSLKTRQSMNELGILYTIRHKRTPHNPLIYSLC